MFEGQRAVGVQASRWGEIHELRADREVVLCGGAYNSPQLLMLSGIGPADDLARLGLPVVQDLPCVGHGLQDHPVVWLSWAHDEPVSLLSAGTEEDMARFTQEGRGPLCSNVSEAGGFVRTHPRLPAPDVQFHVAPVLIDDLPASTALASAPACSPRPVAALSRLRSADPTAKPYILHNYYAEEPDLATMVEGVRHQRPRSSPSALLGLTPAGLTTAPASPSNADCAHTSAGTPLPSTTLSARAGWALTTRP